MLMKNNKLLNANKNFAVRTFSSGDTFPVECKTTERRYSTVNKFSESAEQTGQPQVPVHPQRIQSFITQEPGKERVRQTDIFSSKPDSICTQKKG
jgi:hypothetical protein